MSFSENEGIQKDRIAGGLTADVFLLGSDRVLKVFKPRFYEYAEVEYRKTLLAASLGIPVPRMYALTVTETGAPAIEMERLPGITLSRYFRDHPAGGPVLLVRLARLVVRMERIPYTFSDADAGFAAAYLDKKRFDGSQVGLLAGLPCILPEEFAEIRRFYDSIPESRSFVHGDIGMSNVFVNGQGEPLRLIDFGFSGFGSWLFDFRTMYEKYYEPKYGGCADLIRRIAFRYYLRAYLLAGKRRRGRSTAAILNALGAMVNINRIVSCMTDGSGDGEDSIRQYAGKALRCIRALPDGVCPPDI